MTSRRSPRPAHLVPPTRDGVGPSQVVLPVGAWNTLIDFLCERFAGIPREQWVARMLRGDVLNADASPLAPTQTYLPHARIFYYRDLPAEPVIPFNEVVLYRDDFLVVADKPHFLPVTPSGRYVQQSLLVRLKRKMGIDTLAPMHRIDRETAGLVLFTIQPHTRNAYQALFRDKVVVKQYEAIARSDSRRPFPLHYRSRLVQSPAFMKMCEEPGEPNAETAIDLLEVKGGLGRYALQPLTGQKHQLRAHMNALGLPIENDKIYPHLLPDVIAGSEPDYSQPLQLLAKTITFVDPISGRERHFESGFALQF